MKRMYLFHIIRDRVKIPFVQLVCITLLIAGSIPSFAEVNNWYILIDLYGSGNLEDIENYAGVFSYTTDGYDLGLDQCPEYPPGGGFPDPHFYFPHPEYDGLGVEISGRCDYDFRGPFEATREWEFIVDTSLTGEEFILVWDLEQSGGEVPPEYQVLLLNQDRELIADFWEEFEYRYVTANPPRSMTFYLSVVNDPPPQLKGISAKSATNAIHLEWESSTVPDLAGYVIRYGTEPEEYTTQTYVEAPVTGVKIGELISDATHYFEITAQDRTGLEGLPAYLSAKPIIPPLPLPIDVDENGWIDYVDLWMLSRQWHLSDISEGLDSGDDFSENHLLEINILWHTTPE